VPVFFAELNGGQLNALSRHNDVIAIERLPDDLGPLSDDDGGTSDRFVYVWPAATGAGAKVAVHEAGGVDTTNPFLVDPTYWCSSLNGGAGGSACNIGTNVNASGGHATNVAGVIASSHPWRRGGAWGLTAGSLLSANFQSYPSSINDTASAAAQKVVDAASWALNNGADAINMSWGGCSSGQHGFYSRWADYLVKSYGDSVVVASGNNNCGSPDFVGWPSLGWNTISVGSYYDNNTGGRADDVYSSFTSYRNPTDPNTGRRYEKPDVVGMGGQVSATGSCFGVETTGVGSGANASTCGTSFATPDVTALTALTVGKQPALRNRAEAVKAIIMAGATHNIVDGAGYTACATSPVANDCRDGAGAIDAWQTYAIVNAGAWRHLPSIVANSFNSAGNIDYQVTIPAGHNIRVALAWDSTATCTNLGTAQQACASDRLNADLDLHLLDSNGVRLATAASMQNSAEVLDYRTSGATRTYTIRIHRTRFDAGTNTYAGVAWNLNATDTFNPLTSAIPVALNSTISGQTTDQGRSYWDSYSGPATQCLSFLRNETGLERVYRVTTTTKGTLTATLSNIAGYGGVNGDIDVIILGRNGTPEAQNGQTVGCGETSAVAAQLPAGDYYVVVDGNAGSVARYNLAVSFATNASTSSQPLPQR
jgi:hypothetical protein